MIIYKAKNVINNKCYIGQTSKCLEVRKKEHLHKGYYFYNAIQKYGMDNFKWFVLCDCDTKKELDEMEFHYIKQYHSHISEWGYNLTYGGEGTFGYKHSKESRLKNSLRNKGKTIPYDVRKKISESLKGRVFSIEHIKKISESLKDRVFSTEHKNNISKNHHNVNGSNNPMFGKHHTEEAKKKMSINSSGDNHPMFGIRGENHCLSKSFVIIYPDGYIKNIKGLKNFCKINNLDSSAMRKVAQGKQKQHKGFKCEYEV